MCDHKHHHHEHGHTHTHSHDHDHHHDHTKNREIAGPFCAKVASLALTKDYCDDKRKAIVEFCRIIQLLDSPMDFYQHDTDFQIAVVKLGLGLAWGAKASRHYANAYAIPFGKEPGEVLSIWTDEKLSEIDGSAFPWQNYSLFDEEEYANDHGR